MTEKNRHNLDEALKGMPEHKAGAAGWESVAGGLAQAEESQFLSDNLSSLPTHKAPAGAWGGIAAALKAPFFSLSGGLMKTAGFIAAGAAIVTAVLLFGPEQNKEESVNSADPEKAVTTEKAGIAVTSAEGQKLTPSENTAKIIAEPNGESSVNEETPSASSMSSSPVYNMVSQREDNNDFAGAERDDAIAANTGLVSGRNKLSLNTLPPLDLLHLKVADRISARKTEKVHTDYYSKRGTVEFGIAPFYSLINYQQAEVANMEIPESISGFGIDFMADFPRFFLKSGVSYLSFREKAKYKFEYRRNELVYSYQYVDSAFINHTSGDITYHTSERNIFDSIPGEKADEIEYEYKVLQIPLVAGYKIYRRNNISFSINGGIGADLRIGGREYRPVFNEEEASVVNVVNYLDYRLRINWRLIAGAGLYYRISNRFSFYLEPSYQLYLKSMHQHSGSGNVSYLEIKSGLVWKF